jgi:hypothetical protein
VVQYRELWKYEGAGTARLREPLAYHLRYDQDQQLGWSYPRRKEFRPDVRKATGDVFETIPELDNARLVAELPRYGRWRLC